MARLEVFSSAATGKFEREHSDIDFLIECQPETDLGPWMKHYFKLKDKLEAMLERSVDLVMVEGMRNPYFIRSVNESRTLLYAA